MHGHVKLILPCAVMWLQRIIGSIPNHIAKVIGVIT